MVKCKSNLPMKQVISDYQFTNMSLEKIGLKYGVSDKTIRNILIEAGIQLDKYTYKYLTNQEIKKAYVPNVKWDYKKAEEDYLNGVTLKEIARRYGVRNPCSITTVMCKLGHKPRGFKMSKQAKDLPLDLIISEYQSGMSTKALEEKYGVNNNTIRRRLIKAGVQLRKTWERGISKEDKRAVLVEIFGEDTAKGLIEEHGLKGSS